MGRSSSNLMESYYFYAGILALKLLSLAPLASISCNPEKIQRANVSELKHLTPFWLVAALYMTTSPDEATALWLLRVFIIARFVATFGFVCRIPTCLNEGAFILSFAITSFMGAWVVYSYRHAL